MSSRFPQSLPTGMRIVLGGKLACRDWRYRMTLATVDHVRALPKVELHCHVEGSARASTISALAEKNGIRLPVDDPNELFSFTDLNQFLSIYEIICRSMVTVDDFRRIAYEALEDGAAAG